MEFWIFSGSENSDSNNWIAFYSAIFAALITALATIRAVYVNFKSKNVSEERIKWRERVRYLTKIIVSNNSNSVKKNAVIELETRFNPCDIFDQELINFAYFVSESNGTHEKAVLVRLISIYLKHDWERCKLDSYFFGCLYYLSVSKKTKNYHIEPYPKCLDRISISISIKSWDSTGKSNTLSDIFKPCYPFKQNMQRIIDK
ncbi:hypothetical protein [Providencia sp. wls1921]|uniref:hypothetical protein n=1 Tax=Providencia sp. wls1921 TaxID=2675153 RepID=UPI0012B66CF7|nr:hypothetical protein [Providencia sp. wls1921]MTC42088.1 hypothetical protein [Providencia sp. wls1921]